MTPRIIATVAAIDSLVIGIIGLAAPGALATLFGVEIDDLATALVRLACAAYLGYGVLAWLARDVTDAQALRAVGASNAISWALSAGVVAIAVVSGLGDGRVWILVAMQVAFAGAWTVSFVRTPIMAQRPA